MENYKKGKQVKELLDRNEIPLPNLEEDFVWMKVGVGSKMRNLLKYASKSMGEGKQVVWTALGLSIGKAISCAEILKKKFRTYQITKICYSKVEDYWEPHNSDLEVLVVKREIPTIHILLSRKPLNVNDLSYQEPEQLYLNWPALGKSANSKSTNSDAEETKIESRRAENKKKRSQNLRKMTTTTEPSLIDEAFEIASGPMSVSNKTVT